MADSLVPDGDPGLHRAHQGVDAGVAGDDDALTADAFPLQVVPALLGRRQMKGADPCRDAAIGLLRERGGDVAAAEPRLQVDDGDVTVEAGQGRRGDGGGVALDHDGIRALHLENRIEQRDDVGHDLVEGLARCENIQVVRRGDPQNLTHLIQHLAVLPRDHRDRLEARILLQTTDDRCHLDALGTGPVHGHYFFHDVPQPTTMVTSRNQCGKHRRAGRKYAIPSGEVAHHSREKLRIGEARARAGVASRRPREVSSLARHWGMRVPLGTLPRLPEMGDG